MKDVSVRYAELKDQEDLLDWLDKKSDINCVDYGVLSYPATKVLVAEGDQANVYMPVQTVLMLDALGPRPGISPREMAASLRALTTVVKWEAKNAGHGEVYFTVKDESVAELALRHDEWEEVKNLRVFRKRL